MDDGWYDEAAGPLVRPYAITAGRTPVPSAGGKLDVATQVMTLRSAGRTEQTGLTPEHLKIKRQCQRPLSVAELAVHMNLPLGVIRVLCADLIERGAVIVRSPAQRAEAPDRELLQAVLDGLSNL
nr:multi-component regulatory system-11 [Kibdelosporangium sp. MJ126-NF4]